MYVNWREGISRGGAGSYYGNASAFDQPMVDAGRA
jgi:hypothetical protein